MKRLLGFCFAATMSVSTNLLAAPFLYSFTGYISTIDDAAGAAEIADLYIGDSISYSFIIDRDRLGETTLNDGSLIYGAGSSSIDAFYAELVTGSVIDEVDGGFYNSPDDAADMRSGSEVLTQYPSMWLTGGPEDNFVELYSRITTTNSWGIGFTMTGWEHAFDSTGAESVVRSNMTLTGISPVPVPAAVWLFGSGLVGLVGLNRRKKSGVQPA